MLTNIFKTLGEQTRLEILLIINQTSTLCLCDLESAFQLSSSNLSRHLKELYQNNLLEVEKMGKWKFYRVSELGNKLIPIIEALASSTLKNEVKTKILAIRNSTICNTEQN